MNPTPPSVDLTVTSTLASNGLAAALGLQKTSKSAMPGGVLFPSSSPLLNLYSSDCHRFGRSALAFSANVASSRARAALSSAARCWLKGRERVVGPTWSSSGLAGRFFVVEVVFFFFLAKGSRDSSVSLPACDSSFFFQNQQLTGCRHFAGGRCRGDGAF